MGELAEAKAKAAAAAYNAAADYFDRPGLLRHRSGRQTAERLVLRKSEPAPRRYQAYHRKNFGR